MATGRKATLAALVDGMHVRAKITKSKRRFILSYVLKMLNHFQKSIGKQNDFYEINYEISNY